MILNHMHLAVPDIAKARQFYEEFLDFKYSHQSGDLSFLKDDAGFLLAIHEAKPDESTDLPSWFHFGFCVDDKEQVKELFEKMKSSGIEFVREYTEGDDGDWANFFCWAPGQMKLEVSWPVN